MAEQASKFTVWVKPSLEHYGAVPFSGSCIHTHIVHRCEYICIYIYICVCVFTCTSCAERHQRCGNVSAIIVVSINRETNTYIHTYYGASPCYRCLRGGIPNISQFPVCLSRSMYSYAQMYGGLLSSHPSCNLLEGTSCFASVTS